MTSPPNDTIAAISTATGTAGVAIIRISGPDAFLVADRLTRSKKPTSQQPGHTLRRATAYDFRTGDPLDDGLLAVFHAPHSFTGEDIVEFQGHGGHLLVTRLFASILQIGARSARPGEFSERAFLNGKLDLAQAEAIADMIAATTVTAHRAAQRQLSGELSFAVKTCTNLLKETLAFLEAAIDFPDDVGELNEVAVEQRLLLTFQTITTLLATATYGRRLREGITVVLTGRPNVGKSSLLNALSGKERSIVTAIPGTTRDIVEESLNINGIPIRALDTAGIRETTDEVEKVGVERARQAVDEADVVVLVLDATSPMGPEDKQLLSTFSAAHTIIALNKSDIAGDAAPILPRILDFPIVRISAKTREGLEKLANKISDVATNGQITTDSIPLVTSVRHESALRLAGSRVEQALSTLKSGYSAELISVDVFGAIQALGEITGRTTREDVIAGIFAQFCIGK